MPGALLAHLGAAARTAREHAGLRQIDIATAADLSHTTVSSFETARAWPIDPERLIDIYARECGVRASDLWRAAIDAMFAQDDDPDLPRI